MLWFPTSFLFYTHALRVNKTNDGSRKDKNNMIACIPSMKNRYIAIAIYLVVIGIFMCQIWRDPLGIHFKFIEFTGSPIIYQI